MYHVPAADHVLFTTRCLPVLRARCRVAYRNARDREENTAETIAIAWRMFAKCRERGKYPSHGKLADYAIRHFVYGRRIGQRDNAKDVSGPRAHAGSGDGQVATGRATRPDRGRAADTWGCRVGPDRHFFVSTVTEYVTTTWPFCYKCFPCKALRQFGS